MFHPEPAEISFLNLSLRKHIVYTGASTFRDAFLVKLAAFRSNVFCFFRINHKGLQDGFSQPTQWACQRTDLYTVWPIVSVIKSDRKKTIATPRIYTDISNTRRLRKDVVTFNIITKNIEIRNLASHPVLLATQPPCNFSKARYSTKESSSQVATFLFRIFVIGKVVYHENDTSTMFGKRHKIKNLTIRFSKKVNPFSLK